MEDDVCDIILDVNIYYIIFFSNSLNVGPKLREVHARTPIVMIAGVHLRGMNGIGNRNANGKTVKYMMETTTELSKIRLVF